MDMGGHFGGHFGGQFGGQFGGPPQRQGPPPILEIRDGAQPSKRPPIVGCLLVREVSSHTT